LLLTSEAYQNVLKKKLDVLQTASDMIWNDYLADIQKNSLTGEWAREVVKHLTMEED